MSNIQAIKAELYDLQWHECDGQFTVRADGHFDSDDESCEACSRILLLQNRLQDAVAQERSTVCRDTTTSFLTLRTLSKGK